MSKMKEGPGKNAIKQRALRVLQQKKMYEGQRDQIMQQTFTMEQASLAQDNMKNTMVMVDAMKTTNQVLKQQYGKMDVHKIEVCCFIHSPLKVITDQQRLSLIGYRKCKMTWKTCWSR